MPALSTTWLLNTRNATANFSLSSRAVNTTTNALQVVCAWPVSGQYGPGSRVLFYVLIAACVFAQKSEWLRSACLAAALIFPAVAAIHGIVLAAIHVNGAVDMDVYGAFQLCSIGILAAPVTVRLSRTYFYDPGRNTIFLWTGLVLSGLMSLTVEFYRIQTSDCTHDDSGNPISHRAIDFPYGKNPKCGLTCSIEQGPYSPMRGGSVNNIYVIPVPDKLTFGAATLLAAACCIPAILSLIFMWNKILEINWKTRFGGGDGNEREPIAGTNGATLGKMKGVNNMVRLFLSVVEIPVFGGAVLAILIIGEMNFFSSQVRYQTEPLASIGTWAPIVGTGLAALGSLYLLLAVDVEAVKKEAKQNASLHHCNCSRHHLDGEPHPTVQVQSVIDYSPASRNAQSIDSDVAESPPQNLTSLPAMQEAGFTASSHSTAALGTTDLYPNFPHESATIRPALGEAHQDKRSWTADAGNRRKVAKTLTAIGNYLGNAAHEWFDDSEFRRGIALDFPEIPGEEHRNSALPQIREQYNHRRDENRSITPGQLSRVSSIASSLRIEGSLNTPRAASPQLPQSPFPSPTTPRGQQDNSLPAGQDSSELREPASHSSAGSTESRSQFPQDTLQVPSPVHHNPTRNKASATSGSPIIA